MQNRIAQVMLLTLNVLLAGAVLATPRIAQAFDDDKKGTCRDEVGTKNRFCCTDCQTDARNCDSKTDCAVKVE